MHELIEGTCKFMCPEKERKMRELEGLLHPFEMTPGTEKQKHPEADPSRTIKSFTRSAAGTETPDPSDLRPAPVLLETVFYLLKEIATTEKMPWCAVYDFVFDRLRSVRQDMVIQGVCAKDCVEILVPIIRFHAYAGYCLCEEPLSKFDPKINKTHLNECLKRVLVMFDSLELNTTNNELDLNEIRCKMESLYMLTNLGSTEALIRGTEVLLKIKSDIIKLTLEINLSYYLQNYVRVCRLIRRLPALLASVAALHLPTIRREALEMMSVAFHSRNLRYPPQALQCALLYESQKQLLEDCKHYNIAVDDRGVMFLKGNFDADVKVSPPRRMKFIDNQLSLQGLLDTLQK